MRRWCIEITRAAMRCCRSRSWSNRVSRMREPDAAIQTHGGNGLASEYGLIPYWGLARLLRIAPVNREMVLNYVAQHSLGLPRSY